MTTDTLPQGATEQFIPPDPLRCPDCGEEGSLFYNHCLVGWLCPECFKRVQDACETLAKYKV